MRKREPAPLSIVVLSEKIEDAGNFATMPLLRHSSDQASRKSFQSQATVENCSATKGRATSQRQRRYILYRPLPRSIHQKS
jgi:hypothetical protein